MLKEVDIIQNIITRMGTNAFLIKGWAIAMVSAVLVLDHSKKHCLIAILPVAAFWYADAYYLRQERLFRRLYHWTVTNRLYTDAHVLDLDTRRFKGEVAPIWRTMVSCSILPIYAAALVVITLIWYRPELVLLP